MTYAACEDTLRTLSFRADSDGTWTGCVDGTYVSCAYYRGEWHAACKCGVGHAETPLAAMAIALEGEYGE